MSPATVPVQTGKKEETILKIQKDQKVGRAIARQILKTGVNIHTIAKEVKPYVKYIDIKIDPKEKRKLCPFKVEKALQTELHIAPEQISESRNEEVSKTIEEMKTLMGLTCKMQDHKMFNRSKELMYIRDFDIENMSSFQKGMNIKYKVSEVVRAKWIKPTSENHSAWLITFNSDTLTETINIP